MDIINMPAYQQRVVIEAKDLQEKCDKLIAFMQTKEADDLSDETKLLLDNQLRAMNLYGFFLKTRIAQWG